MSVSGVRNSCEILEKKVVFARSNSAKDCTESHNNNRAYQSGGAEYGFEPGRGEGRTSARFRSSSRAMALVTADAACPVNKL